MHLLCVDIDPGLIANILNREEAQSFSLDICRNLEDAYKKTSANKYDLYLLQYIRGEDFKSFLLSIRNKNPKSKIALLVLSEIPELQELKNLKLIDYVLRKRLFDAELDRVLKDLNVKPEDLKSTLSEVKLIYDESIPTKINKIKTLVGRVQKSLDSIEELKSVIHTIAGSAGSFGYEAVSHSCKAMENEIQTRVASKSDKEPKWLASLDDFVKKIEAEFQICTFQKAETPLILREEVTKPLFYVIDDDIHFIQLLERINDSFGITLIVEFDPFVAMEQLRNPDFNPQGIVVKERFRNLPIDGYTIFDLVRKKNLSPPPIFALLLAKDNLEERFKAMNKGIDYVFSKPISAQVLLNAMNEALQSSSLAPIKVLVVDDDPFFCDYVHAVLEEIGISTYAIYTPEDLLDELEDYKPNILLLDICLPKYDGLSLLKSLRRDITLKNLIIITVTGSGAPDVLLNAYAANADDVLFKPINKEVLQKRILSIASRKSVAINSIDNETGLPQMKELIDDLELLLKKDWDGSCFFGFFEVDKFNEWAKDCNHPSTKALIIFLSNHLQWEADKEMKCYWYKNSQFAIVFKKTILDLVEDKLYKFLLRLVQSKPEWHLSFNCGIVPISSNCFKTASNLLQTAEEILIESAKKEEKPIKIERYLLLENKMQKKEIFIVDPNEDLLKILKHAFESHRLKVHTFIEGGDALKQIVNEHGVSSPSLIIAERQLPDMDGIDLHYEIRQRFSKPIPFFMLTVFAADKDLIEGVRQGVDYIIKPFNISILVQKALQVIYPSRG